MTAASSAAYFVHFIVLWSILKADIRSFFGDWLALFALESPWTPVHMYLIVDKYRCRSTDVASLWVLASGGLHSNWGRELSGDQLLETDFKRPQSRPLQVVCRYWWSLNAGNMLFSKRRSVNCVDLFYGWSLKPASVLPVSRSLAHPLHGQLFEITTRLILHGLMVNNEEQFEQQIFLHTVLCRLHSITPICGQTSA